MNNLFILLLILLSTSSVKADVDRLRALRTAEILATRNLLESIAGLKIHSESSYSGKLADESVSVTSEAKLPGIRITHRKYGLNEIAMAVAEIPIVEVAKFLQKPNSDLQGSFQAVGYATANELRQPMVNALRVAQIDAYKRLMQQVNGMNVMTMTVSQSGNALHEKLATKNAAFICFVQTSSPEWDEVNEEVSIEAKVNPIVLETFLGHKFEAPIHVTGFGSWSYVRPTGNEKHGAALPDPDQIPVRRNPPAIRTLPIPSYPLEKNLNATTYQKEAS